MNPIQGDFGGGGGGGLQGHHQRSLEALRLKSEAAVAAAIKAAANSQEQDVKGMKCNSRQKFEFKVLERRRF
jgi:hypothetical protein